MTFGRLLTSHLGRLGPRLTATAAVVHYSFEEKDRVLEKMRGKAKTSKLETSKYFKDTFLIKHSCALSLEAASGLITQVYVALEEVVEVYVSLVDELIRFYQDTSVRAVDAEERAVELQTDVRQLKEQIGELEMLLEFTKKLLELNAEVSFLGGAEFVSTQASERLHSVSSAGAKLITSVHQRDQDLAAAKAQHIRRTKTREESDDQ